MPDQIYEYPAGIRRKFVDQGDGSYAERVSVGGSVATTPATGVTYPVEPLGIPSVSHNLPATATSANTALTTTCRRASIYACNADIRYSVGATAQTASATSHFIASGERLDIALPPNANIAVIRDGSVDGILCVSELA